MNDQPTDTEQHVQRLAEALGERERHPVAEIRRIIKIMGVDFADTLLAETLAIEEQGGLFLERENRRRTPGGVFFHLARKRLTRAQREKVFPFRQSTPRKQPSAQPQPQAERRQIQPLDPEALPEIIQALAEHFGQATTVKITVVGRPLQVVERGDVVILGIVTEKIPSLPRAFPTPPQQTKYLVLVAKKQWNKVAEVVTDPDDRLIIEGYSAFEPRHAGIAVYTLSVTTKKQEMAKRAAK